MLLLGIASLLAAVIFSGRGDPAFAAGSGGIAVSPASQLVLQGGAPFGVDIRAVAVSNIGSFDFTLHYNPAVLSYVGVAVGPFLSSTGRATFCPPAVVDNIAGTVQFGCASFGLTPPGPTGDGRLATLAFSPVAAGTSPLTFVNTLTAPYSDEGGNAFTAFTFANGSVTVFANNGTPLPTSTQTLTPTITPTPTNTAIITPTPTGVAPPGACGPQIALAICPQPPAAAGNDGSPLNIDIRIEDVANLGAFSVTLEYSNAVFPAPPSFALGPFLGSSGRTVACLPLSTSAGATAATSQVRENCLTLGAPPPAGTEPFGPAGSATLGTFTFMPAITGTTVITLPAVQVLDAYAVNDPTGHSDVSQVTIGAFLSPTPCPGVCPTSTPTATATPTPVPTATNTPAPTFTATPSPTPCAGACPSATPSPTSTATAAAVPATVRIAPLSQTAGTGQIATFGVYIDNATNLGAFAFQVAFDPLLLKKFDIQGCLTQPGGCQPSSFLLGAGRHITCFLQGATDTGGAATPTPGPATDPSPGVFGFNCIMLDPPGTPGATGSGLLATISLQALAPAAGTPLHLRNVQLLSAAAQSLVLGTLIDGSVTIVIAPTATPCAAACPASTPLPTLTPTPTVVPGSIANVSFFPQQQLALVGQTVDVALNIANVKDLGAYQFQLKYDPFSVEFVSATDGGFISSTGRVTFCPPAFTASAVINFGCVTSGATPPGPSGSGALAHVQFRTLRQAAVDLQLLLADLSDPSTNAIPRTITDTLNEIIILGALPTATATPTATPTPSNQGACVTQPLGTGSTCFVIDADPATPGEQNVKTLPASGSFTVDIVARNVPATSNGLGFFNATVLYDPLFLTAGVPTSTLPVTNNFNCLNASARLPEGSQFADGNPATGDAFINCFDPVGLIGPSGTLVIASIPFTINGAGSSQLRFFSSSISSELGINLASCNPVDLQPGAGCLDGLVYNVQPTPTATPVLSPTATFTATATFTPTNTATPTSTPTATPFGFVAPPSVGGLSVPPDIASLPARRGGSPWGSRILVAIVGALALIAASAIGYRRRPRASSTRNAPTLEEITTSGVDDAASAVLPCTCAREEQGGPSETGGGIIAKDSTSVPSHLAH
jgi:hypothetical protein